MHLEWPVILGMWRWTEPEEHEIRDGDDVEAICRQQRRIEFEKENEF